MCRSLRCVQDILTLVSLDVQLKLWMSSQWCRYWCLVVLCLTVMDVFSLVQILMFGHFVFDSYGCLLNGADTDV